MMQLSRLRVLYCQANTGNFLKFTYHLYVVASSQTGIQQQTVQQQFDDSPVPAMRTQPSRRPSVPENNAGTVSL